MLSDLRNPPTMIALEGYRAAQRSEQTGELRPPAFWGIFETREAAQAHLDAMLEAREFNYYVGWRDTQGWGLQATFAAWVGEGAPHIDLGDAAGVCGW